VNTFLTPEANLYFRCLKEELVEDSQLNRIRPFQLILINADGSGRIELSTYNDTEITHTHTHTHSAHTHTHTHTYTNPHMHTFTHKHSQLKSRFRELLWNVGE